MYKLNDWGGDPIEGVFYAAELQKVTEDPNQEYRIQDIVKKRTRNKQKEVLVKWLHWPKKYNSWIPEADVRQYGQV
jgi:AAA+ superfamily predicted ATPase